MDDIYFLARLMRQVTADMDKLFSCLSLQAVGGGLKTSLGFPGMAPRYGQPSVWGAGCGVGFAGEEGRAQREFLPRLLLRVSPHDITYPRVLMSFIIKF